MKKNSDKGSVTIEAAILLPVFIIAVISFVYIIKIYYTHEIIQQAITGASNEMSVYSLLYYETNAEELISGIEKFSNSDKMAELADNSAAAEYIENLGKEAADYVRAQIALVPLTKHLVMRNLTSSFNDNVDYRLKGLNIKNGFSGIDFSNSRLLADGKSVDIAAEYELSFPFLPQLLPPIKIYQSASCCIWAGEKGINQSEQDDKGEGEENIWSLSNIQRGRKIRALQGANLPFSFPTVAIYQNGTVTSIKSLNIDEAYYLNQKNLKQKLLSLINKLEDFSGGSCGNVTIRSSEIYKKELRLIIPETDLKSDQQQTMDECIRIARIKGIELKIIKAYGKGTYESNESNSGNQAANE